MGREEWTMAHDILIVEDDQHERMLYEEDFTELGYEVRLAQDADVALAMIRDKRPDLVVLDINMPGKDGLDLLREIMDIDNKLGRPQHGLLRLSAELHELVGVALMWSSRRTPPSCSRTVKNILAGESA